MYEIYSDNTRLYAPGIEELLVVEPKLVRSINEAGSLEFKMQPNHMCYDVPQKLKGTIRVKQDGQTIWAGRVLHDEISFYKFKNIYCEGALAFLNDSQIAPENLFSYDSEDKKYLDRTETAATWLSLVLQNHNNLVNDDRKLVYFSDAHASVTDEVTIDGSDSYRSAWDIVQEILDQCPDGYLKLRYDFDAVDKIELGFFKSYGETTSQVIEFGVNLLDLTEYIDATELYTILIATGKVGDNDETVTLPATPASDTSVQQFGKIYHTESLGEFESIAELRAEAQSILDKGKNLLATLTVKAVDLHLVDSEQQELAFGSLARVISIPHGINREMIVSELELILDNPAKSTYTLGDKFEALTDKQVKAQRQINAVSAIKV